MIWDTVPFRRIHEDLLYAGAASDLDAIITLLNPIKEDLLQLLASPSKSETSRDRLSKKILKLGGEEIEVNDAFINDAARIADELNLDEIVAAEIAFHAIGDAQRLSVSIFEAGLTVYYVRRQYIIDIVRYCLEVFPVEKFNIILGEKESRLPRILGALKAVEMAMEDLNDKSKTVEFMGYGKTPEFTQTLKMQKEFLVREHESLGCVFYAYISAFGSEENSVQNLTSLIKHLEGIEVLDSRILSYIPALVLWLSAPHSETFNGSVWQSFKSVSATTWKLPILQSGLALTALTALAEEDASLPESLQYDDILGMVKEVIDAGALEFWLAISQDVKNTQGDGHFSRFKPLVRSRISSFQFWQPTPTTATLENLQNAFEILVSAIITNLADTLREMRLSEEDMYLAMSEADSNVQSTSPGLDFERFILFAAIISRNQPSASNLFLGDDSDPLFGFLRWASDCQVTFMSAAFVELIASLANDEMSCKVVHEFLVSKTGQKSANEDQFVLSWSYIYDVIEYYVRGMSTSSFTAGNSSETANSVSAANFAMPGVVSLQPQSDSVTSSAAPATAAQGFLAPSDPNSRAMITSGSANPSSWGIPDLQAQEVSSLSSVSKSSTLSDDTLFILSAYMTLLARVSDKSPEARSFVRGKTEEENASNVGQTRDIVPLLFKLLKLQKLITGPIFDALVPFSCSELWPMLDNLVLGKFDEILLSRDDALAFLRLVKKLVGCEQVSPRLSEYFGFILNEILPWTVNFSDEHDLWDVDRVLLQLNSLELLRILLARKDYREQLSRLCFQTRVHEAIFKVLTFGLDNIADLDSRHPLVRAIECSVEVTYFLLKNSVSPSSSFDKPILYHLQVVPHLALYAGSLHRQLSFSSIETLSLLERSPEFRPTINRQSRILSILSSTTESTRIRVGLMMRLADSATDVSVKVALLEMLLGQLQENGSPRRFMTVAHYLLGFNQSELGLELKLGLEGGVGGVLSGSSLLSAVCDVILQSSVDQLEDDAKLLGLCSSLLWHLVKDPLTSEMVLDFLRESDFWLNTIKNEAVRIENPDYFRAPSEQKADMLEIWISEIQLCQKKLLLTIECHYLDALVPLVFSMVNFDTASPGEHMSNHFLKAWCKLIPILIASGDKKTGPAFVSQTIQILMEALPSYSRQDPELAVPIAQLLVFLFDTYQQRGSDDSMARHMRHLSDAALMSLQPAQVNGKLRTSLYLIIFQNLRLGLRTGSLETQNEMFEALKVSSPKVFHIACDDVLGYVDNQLRLGALLFVQMSVILAGRLKSEFVSDVLLQYNFVSIFIQEIAVPALDASKSNSKDGALLIEGIGAHRNTSGNTQALVIAGSRLDAQNKVDGNASSAKQEEAGVTGDFSNYQLAKLSLSLLLPIAQTRAGAANLLNSSLLSQLESCLSDLNEELLSSAIQLLIAIVISVGPEDVVALDGIRRLLKGHRAMIQSVLQREVAGHHSLQDQSGESEVSNVARNLTILVSLTSGED